MKQTRKTQTIISLAAVIICLGTGSLALAAGTHEHLTQRQLEVEKSGSAVMPFDLTKTTHVFDDKTYGGLQTVKANDPHDTTQICLIRQHLSHLAVQFRHGNFTDPTQVHGKDMPGLAQLEAAGSKLKVSYRTIPTGATLRYSSQDSEVVTAIHTWFAAQRSDHAAHGHVMHDHQM